MASAPSSSNHNHSRSWSFLCRSLSLRTNSSSQHMQERTIPLKSIDSVVIGDEFHAPTATRVKPEGHKRPIRSTVRSLMRRASISFSPSHKRGPLVVNGAVRGERALGDGESGIVLDEGDKDESYYVQESLAKRFGHILALALASNKPVGDLHYKKDFVKILPPEITAQIMSYLDHKTVINCEMMSRAWREAARNTHVWRNLFHQEHCDWQSTPGKDWKTMFKVKKELNSRWTKAEMSYKYLQGHTDSVYCVQFDDKKVVTGSRDRAIRIWDIQSGECLKVLGPGVEDSNTPESELHTASVLCLQYDDSILVTGSSDNTCIVWDLATYRAIGRLSHHTAGVLDVCFNDKYIVSCSKDTTICVWDRKTRALKHHLTGHKGPVNAVAMQGNMIVSASGDALVKLWDASTGECVREFKGHHRGLACVQFSEDKKTIVSGGNDQDIRIWDAQTAECKMVLPGHKNLVRTLHLDSKNKRIISGSYDASVKVWSLETGKMILDIKQFHSTWILAAKSDHKRIVSTSQDARTLVLDFSSNLRGIEILDE